MRDGRIAIRCLLRACRRQSSRRRDDPIYHPFLYGAQQDGNARAGFYGIAGWHTKGHLIRALLEGVAFGHRQHIETMRAAGAVLRRSGAFRRRIAQPDLAADLCRCARAFRSSVARSRETGALGAAIAAGTGVGIFADFCGRCGSHGEDGTPLPPERAR